MASLQVPRQPFYKIAFRRACEKNFSNFARCTHGSNQFVFGSVCVWFSCGNLFCGCVFWLRFSIHSPSSGGSFFEFVCVLETRNSNAPLITSCWQREIKGPFIFSSVIQTTHTQSAPSSWDATLIGRGRYYFHYFYHTVAVVKFLLRI